MCFESVSKKSVIYTFPFAWESSRGVGSIVGASPGAPVIDGEKLLHLEVKDGAMKLTVVRERVPTELTLNGVKRDLVFGAIGPRADVTDAACRDAP
ncbi:hypothetical protein BH09MYX1_BH09MYX1_24520 [soil metagenome]